MTRFAWLQSRTQTLTVAALLAALAVLAAVTGVQLSHVYDSLVAHCQSGCELATSRYLSHDSWMQHALDILAQLTPALFGVFWGAPLLSREFETGTYRLAWTQSVPRSRWLLVKLGVTGAVTVLLAALLSLTVTWWYRGVDLVSTNQYAVFDRRDITPVGYALFALAAGALLGTLVRRTLPAMAATLAVFVTARVAVASWVRPHLLPPLHATVSLLAAGRFGFTSSDGSAVTLDAQGDGPPGSWTLSSQLITTSGHLASAAERAAFMRQHCPTIADLTAGPGTGGGPAVGKAPDPAAFEACRTQAAQAFHLAVTYQPASRYWTMQWLETGIFVALAALAAAMCYQRVTRHTH